MKPHQILGALAAIILCTRAAAQTPAEKALGQWKTPDRAVVEVVRVGKQLTIRQVSAEKEKDKAANGKLIGKDIVAQGDALVGLAVDPSNGKEYKATWRLSADGKKLTIKVKWGFINFNEDWQRI